MKYLLITHTDLDGVSPIILLNLFGKEFDYFNVEVHEAKDFLEEKLKEGLDIYEKIYITDLSLSEESYKIMEESEYRDKIFVFDHHASHLFAKEYKNVTIDINECGTTIFYKYLEKENGKINDGILDYINNVRDIDIWLWEQNNNMTAVRLDNLFRIYGKDVFIKQMCERLETADKFEFNELETMLIESQEKRAREYMIKKEKEIFKINYLDKKAVAVYADRHKSILGHHLAKKNPDCDYVIVINPSGGISFRSEKEDADLTKVAATLGGGGHKKASGASFPKELQEKIILELFKGSEIIDESKSN
jgi:Predicted phosphohydrolase (DHH superfamily)